MTLLIILGVILLILLGALFIPVRVDLELIEEFKFKVSFLKITLFKSETQKEEPKKQQTQRKESQENKPKNGTLENIKAYFKGVKEEKGLNAAIKEGFSLVGELLGHIKRLFKHINICKVKLNVTVSTPDAALTAIEYGSVCTAVYPVTSFLDSVANIGFKEINITADFKSGKSDFSFSGTVKMQIFYLLICAYKIYKPLKKFITEKKENERK